MFWLGILAGMVVAAFAPGWMKAIVFIAAVVFSGLLVRIPAHPQGIAHLHLTVPPLVIVIGSLAFGAFAWHYARLRGLQHLGSAELRTRWANVRNISKWGW